jgi:S-methylmethionine-dependent homocysteine/selenocysteine methylase
MAPLDDCYLPVFSVPAERALAEHRAQARNLAAAGVDLLLVETMPTAAEAAIALRAAAETGLPATVGFVCEPADGDERARLLSKETLDDAVRQVRPFEPVAIFVNCAPPPVIETALRELSSLTSIPFGAYANAGRVDDAVGWSPDESLTGERYAAQAREWVAIGARVVGGCCGTHAGHTAALRRLIDTMPAA